MAAIIIDSTYDDGKSGLGWSKLDRGVIGRWLHTLAGLDRPVATEDLSPLELRRRRDQALVDGWLVGR
jgi:hypothetical protein